MAFPKNALFPQLDQQLSDFGRTLGHPARISILRMIVQEGPQHVMDLVRALPLSEGTISEHLRKLRLVGLIEVDIQGLKNVYSLNKPGLTSLYNLQLSLFEDLGVVDGSALSHGGNTPLVVNKV